MISQTSQMTDTVSRYIAEEPASETTEQKHASKILALSSVLQTTLEINELITLFAREIGKFIEFEGIAYHSPALNISIDLGTVNTDQHICTYKLLVTEQDLGELKLTSSHPFNTDDLELVENLMVALLYPLRNTLLYQQAVNSASTDPLTGVLNRMTMEQTLKREIELSRRHKSPLSVILMDIDHFKRINDANGHLAGDQVLARVAQCAKTIIRESDMIFRYGGEEFLILLTNTGIEGASMLAERIRKGIESLTHKTPVTVSLGVSSMQEQDRNLDLIKRADKALYQAKEAGRNRTVRY